MLLEKTLSQLRHSAREIFDAALLAVDAKTVTQRLITSTEPDLRIGEIQIQKDQRIYVVSIGKAATRMAAALNEVIGERITSGIVASQEKTTELSSSKWQQFQGGHPLPNAQSIAAAEAASRLLLRANEKEATVIFAVSGGGSAMIELPVKPEITLADLQETNRLLVSCGASIAEINTVRRAFSAVKGGKLASLAPRAQVLTLIISDTNNGDEANVASGPSLPTLSGTTTAIEIVQHYHLESKLPATVVRAITQSSSSSQPKLIASPHFVLADNGAALRAAASRSEQLSLRSVIDEEILEQPIDLGCQMLLDRFNSESSPLCLISGGEFSCPLRGDGRGGRNSETVLRMAIATENQPAAWVILSAGTDGIDGNSPAAGAFADSTTLARARSLGLSAEEFLARSDSFGFFEKLGDLIVTGPTGTNVRDVRLFIKRV